jgi:hypothetical protein
MAVVLPWVPVGHDLTQVLLTVAFPETVVVVNIVKYPPRQAVQLTVELHEQPLAQMGAATVVEFLVVLVVAVVVVVAKRRVSASLLGSADFKSSS